MKKFLSYGIIACLAIVLVIPFLNLFGESNKSIDYLKEKPLSPWSIMALSSAGEDISIDSLKTVASIKAIDLEAPILAITAFGKNPRSFGSEDLVAKLKGFYDGTQIGEAEILNDDIFGLLALRASGENNGDPVVAGIRDFIISKQNSDGGFSFAVGGTSDTNTTAAAIMALRSVGVSASDGVIANAISYLKAAQNSDGGFPYDPKSSWGIASDASSDAWVIMAVRSLGDDISLWNKEGKTPVEHLESLKQENGFYLYQAGGVEDSFTPVTTSYALLALSGKTIPVKIVAPEISAGVLFSAQIEGKAGMLCDTDGVGKTALDVLKKAAEVCSIAYHLQSSSLGDYVDEIAGEKASGASGWLYSVNGVLASVGAGAYQLKEGDAVRWYFGNFDGTAISNAVRTEVPLSVTISGPSSVNNGGNAGGNRNTETDEVSMIVEAGNASGSAGALGFGAQSRGGVAVKIITLKNSGAVSATFSTSVSGSALFRRYLRLNDMSWRDYRATLASQFATTTKLSLSIPSDYNENGVKTGSLVFWATPVAQ